jgi:hypothetical protein
MCKNWNIKTRRGPMLNLFKSVPARRRAMAALKPFIAFTQHSATRAVPNDWLQPHVLGFLSTAITLIAEAPNGPLQSHALGAVQTSVMVSITGGSAQVAGEEITLLSSKRDPEFMAGCRAAYQFVEALSLEHHRHVSDKAGLGPFVPEQASGDDIGLNAHGLWREHVVHYLTQAAGHG